jgi:hypothetical protein
MRKKTNIMQCVDQSRRSALFNVFTITVFASLAFGYILWCLSWPVSVAVALQEPFGTTPSSAFQAVRLAAAISMLLFYIGGTTWLIHRSRKAMQGGVHFSIVVTAWAALLFLNPFGPVALLLSNRILRDPSAAPVL